MQLAVPSVVIMLVSAMYNVADTYFVGTTGTSATAAVGVAFSLQAVIQAIGFFFGHGAGNYISRALGAQQNDNAGRMAATGFFTAFALGVVIAVTGLLCLKPLARALGATETIVPYACDYLRYILIAAPFMISSFMLNNLLRFQGAAFWGMVGMVSGAALNVALDPLFIFGFDMGVSGAALATLISQTLSFTLLFVVGCTRKYTVRILLRNFTPEYFYYKEMLRGGTPSLLRQSLLSIATLALNHAAGIYGDAVIAAMAIVSRVMMIATSVLLGIGQGYQPVCGFNYGAQRYARVKQGFWFCFRFSTCLLIVAAIFCFIMASDIIAVFRGDDPAVISVGALALRFQCFSLPFTGWIVLNNMMLQTIGKAAPASLLAFSRQGLFLIPLLSVMTPLWGILGIQLCAPVADICTFILAIPLGVRTLRGMKT